MYNYVIHDHMHHSKLSLVDLSIKHDPHEMGVIINFGWHVPIMCSYTLLGALLVLMQPHMCQLHYSTAMVYTSVV